MPALRMRAASIWATCAALAAGLCPRPVYILMDNALVDEDQGAANLLSEVQNFSSDVTSWGTVADMVSALDAGLEAESVIVIPEQENGILVNMLSDAQVATLAQHVEKGVHLIVSWHEHGLITAVTNWTVADTACSDPPYALVLSGGGFATGPAELPLSGTRCNTERSLPDDVDGRYGAGGSVAAWTSPFGHGRVTFLGDDWIHFTSDWSQLLEASIDWCGTSTSTSASTSTSMSTATSTSPTMTSTSTSTSPTMTSASTSPTMTSTSTSTAMSTTSTSTTVTTATDCLTYVLLDPSVVDMSKAGANLQANLLSLMGQAHTWVNATDMLQALNAGMEAPATIVVAAQGLASLHSALGPEGVEKLKHQVHEGLHLLVLGSNEGGSNRDAELINAVTGWRLSHSNTTCMFRDVLSRRLGGGGFAAGPEETPWLETVYCFDEDSLPNAADGFYEGGGEVSAWTAPLGAAVGAGRVTYLGADWASVTSRHDPWSLLLESSLKAVCTPGAYDGYTGRSSTTSTSTTTSTSQSSTSTSIPTSTSTTTTTSSTTYSTATACSVHLLMDPDIVDNREGANVQADVSRRTHGYTKWSNVADMRSALDVGLGQTTILVPEQERGSLLSKLGPFDVSSLTMGVATRGLQLLVLGTWNQRAADLINAVTNWTVTGGSELCDSEPSMPRVLHGGFAGGPAELPYTPYVFCHEESSLPSDVDGLYAFNGKAFAWTAPFGSGRITYLGLDWFDVHCAWSELLESALDAVCKLTSSTSKTVVSTSSSVTSTSTTVVTSSTTSASSSDTSPSSTSSSSITSATTRTSRSSITSTSTTVSITSSTTSTWSTGTSPSSMSSSGTSASSSSHGTSASSTMSTSSTTLPGRTFSTTFLSSTVVTLGFVVQIRFGVSEENFLGNATMLTVLKSVLAELLEVPQAWTDVITSWLVSPSNQRLLSAVQTLRRVTAVPELMVIGGAGIPEGNAEGIQAAEVQENADAVTDDVLTWSLAKAMKDAGFDNADVSAKRVTADAGEGHAGSPSGDGIVMMVLGVVIACLSVMIMGLIIVVCRRRRPDPGPAFALAATETIRGFGAACRNTMCFDGSPPAHVDPVGDAAGQPANDSKPVEEEDSNIEV